MIFAATKSSEFKTPVFAKVLKAKALFFAALLAVSVVAFMLAMTTLMLDRWTGNITIIWPVDAVLLALMLGYFRKTPLTVLVVGEVACMAATMMIGKHAILPPLMLPLKVSNGWIIYKILDRFTDKDRFSKSLSLLFFITSCGVASIFSGLIFSVITHEVEGTPLFAFTLRGAANSELGYIVITPLLAILFSERTRVAGRTVSPARTLAIIGAFSVSLLLVFAQSRYPLLFLIPIGFMGVVYTVDMKAVAVAVLSMVIIATVATASGHGPLHLIHAATANQFQALQVFIGIMTITTLPTAAMMAEHANLKQSLIDARVEAEAASRAKSVFLATVSHEIRTPLNGVLGMAQIMSMDELSASQRERVEVVRRSGEALLCLLNDVLDLSKIEAGKLTFETIDFDLGAVLGGVISAFESLAREKAIALTLDLGSAEGCYRGDPLRLRQIIFNLISNALKFTDVGEVRIASNFDTNGLTVTVSDTGIGVPADKVGALFSKFNQVDESTTRRFGGTGLGLSICRELAELMVGSIAVESVEGRGSTFTLRLPLERTGQIGVPAGPAAKPRAAPRDNLRVLAAEDNPTNRLVLKTLLAFSGVEVAMVENGAEAVKAFADADWDVILMDVQMPVMDGPTAARAIRKAEAEAGRERTPIIALTANTMAHQVTHYIEAGMDGHLAKPIELAALIEVLANLVPQPEAPGRLEDVA